jgi:hypothetical protein
MTVTARQGSGPRIRFQFLIDGERTPGIELVERLITTGDYVKGGVTAETAAEALEALEHLELPWLVNEMVEGGEGLAEQVHSEATRGLQEVIQNADDQGARRIRFGYRKRSRDADLLVAHDGNPVEIQDVVRMAYPLLSGSREDPDKIGRFGIGLKTLNQFGESLAVHCPPLPGFEIRGGRVARISSRRALAGFWDPTKRETLFVLRLDDHRFDLKFFKEWIAGWDVSSLLFLRGLQHLQLVDLDKRQVVGERGVSVSKPKTPTVSMPNVTEVEQVTLSDLASTRAWTRYTARYPRPKHLRAKYKQMGERVRLQIAIPRRQESSRIFVGLPLEEESDLPFSISAPFDPNADRTHLRDHNELNEWLIARIGDLASAVAVARFVEQPRQGWRAIALREEGAGTSNWVQAQFTEMVERQLGRVARSVRMKAGDGSSVRLRDFLYEPEEFEELLTSEDLVRLWDETSSQYGKRRPVPKSWRDGGGRWRAVLEEIEGADPLTAEECLTALDWSDDDTRRRGAVWLVQMIDAARKAGVVDELWTKACIPLEDGSRLVPAEVAEGGVLLVHSLPSEGLAAVLGLAQKVARALRGRNDAAEQARAWLREKHVLRERASDGDAVRSLARANRSEPIDLSRRDKVLVRLRNTLDQMPAEERAEIGAGVGRNVLVQGYEFMRGSKVRIAVRPSSAYLPSAIDKNEGWPTAAAQTPGIYWIDTRYRDMLRGARGQGALASLKTLGAEVGPRLVSAGAPTMDPNATRLLRTALCDQHRAELSDFPRATGLEDDWVSPDLEAVVADLMKDGVRSRRRRARALFLTLDRGWDDYYAAHATARAVRHYYSWERFGDVSATWLARLASLPWLSTREDKFKAAAPRELTILTEASYEIDERPERYVREIEADHVDAPAVAALQIEGRPFASSIVARLETMREAEEKGEPIAQSWVDRTYNALSSYAPNGAYHEQSDLSPRQLQARFTSRKRGHGLIRVDGKWLPPAAVRGAPFLDPVLPHVTGAEHLWDVLGITSPTVDDCVTVLKALAERQELNPSSEIRVFRHLCEIAQTRRNRMAGLKDVPLRTYRGWQARQRKPIYAVPNPVLAESLGSHWDVWKAPLPIEELDSLLPALGVQVLGEEAFEADIPSHTIGAGLDLKPGFAAAVGHLSDYLAVNHPVLHQLLTPTRWAALAEADIVVGDGWGIRVRAGPRRSTRLTVRAHLFEAPIRFCVLHDDEAGDHDSGGQAIAAFFAGSQLQPEQRSTIALAWSYVYGHRLEERIDVDLAEREAAEDAPPMPGFGSLDRRSRPQRGKRKLKTTRTPTKPAEEPRELVDINALDLASVSGTFLEAKRRGTLRASSKARVKPPKTSPAPGAGIKRATRTGTRSYSDRDREDIAYTIVDAVLTDTHGLKLTDTRDQPAVGADAVDEEQDIWIEIKAHGRDASDALRLEPSEALRAREKRGRYWLVVVWDLEQPRTPKFVVIPDPLHRLDLYLASGLRLTGVADLAEQSAAAATRRT